MGKGPVIEIRNMTRRIPPRVPFQVLARRILPRQYNLSLVLCGDAVSKRMNAMYRKKQYAPNVLSFPYSRTEGEIFINLKKAAKEARAFGMSPRDRIAHLFVHACLHLIGWKHGARMDTRERTTLRAFGFKHTY